MKNPETKRVIFLIGIMAAVVLVVLGTSGTLLYQTAVKMQRQRLEAALELHIRMITVNIEHELSETERHDSQTQLIIEEKVIGEMRKVNETNPRGFDRPVEFVWGRREGADIMFLLPLRHSKATSVPFDSKLAEPMRLALKGQTGTMIGLDYRDEKVLSAYVPLNILGRHYGIVCKIDMSEVRTPFIAVGVVAFFLAIASILAGVVAFLRITNPMLRRIQKDEKNLQELDIAKEASRAKNEFLSMAAHELRAPLSGISGLAQTLRDAHNNGWLAQEEDMLPDFLNKILQSVFHMAALIDELLEFS
ncbi:MAG: hypothetical protein HQL01_14415, partial [Nitrospirae bacterium]|nr:hypothetical protein [Nitrospirota bacterium]